MGQEPKKRTWKENWKRKLGEETKKRNLERETGNEPGK